ncbi:phage tail protein [Photobacterium iliopiscarium]|uniref:Phage tail fibre protein N-terminal domain-containing protein n=1 Tax=Photobacterium iliopiscarium TaxID=56192 RepID=A0ABX5GSR2_9GAMM|nr:phage tail protein [Photobacterium iliopiscarium]PSW98026.1 hypothetical protein C9J52_08825 [Photobacterium iliopiscarium]
MSNTATVITTKAGEALIAQMQAENKVLVIDKFIFANVPNRPAFPDRDDVVPVEHVVHESAVHEQGRLTENSVIYSTTLASNVGPFSFNWSGLFCSEHNVLVAINFPPPVDKTVDAPGITGNTLVRSFVLEYKGISETTNITVDPSSWQYDAHKRMSKMDNDTAQAIIDQNGKDWFIDDGFIVTPQSSAYSIKAGAGYVSGHRISLDFDRILQVPEKPAFIYVDAFREGSPTGEWQTKFTFVVAAEEKDDYTDAQGVNHFVCKIAQVFEDGSVADVRSKSSINNYTNTITEVYTDGVYLEWQPNLNVSVNDALKFFNYNDNDVVISYLPNAKKLPFTTGESFLDDEKEELWKPYINYHNLKQLGFSILLGVKVGSSIKLGHDLYEINGALYPVANPKNAIVEDIDLNNKIIKTNKGDVFLLNYKFFNRNVIDVRAWWITGHGNENDKVQRMNGFLSTVNRVKIVNYSNVGLVTVDRLNIPSFSIYKDSEFGFTDKYRSSLDEPLMTGDNFICGVHGHTLSTYPVKKFTNVKLKRCKFKNLSVVEVRRQIGCFVGFDNLTLDECEFDNIGGGACSFLGCVLPYPEYKGSNVRLEPHEYSTKLTLSNNKLYRSGYVEAGKFNTGGGFQVAGVKGIALYGNDAIDIGASYLVDFLNISFYVSDNSSIIKDERFGASSEKDVLGIYIGQATYDGSVMWNRTFSGHKKGYYLEGCSNVEIANNLDNKGNASLKETYGLAISPNPLDKDQKHQVLDMLEIKVHHNKFTDYETPLLGGSIGFEDSLELFADYNHLIRSEGSNQPSLVLAEIKKGTAIGNSGNGYAHFAGVKQFDFSFNNLTTNGYALYVKNDTYNSVTGYGNTLATSGKFTCYAENQNGGYIRLHGGSIISGSEGIVEGAGKLELIGYANGFPKVIRETILIDLLSGKSLSGYLLVEGVTVGDQIKMVANTTGEIICQCYVSEKNNVRYTIANVSVNSINVNVDFDIHVEKYSSSLYRD